jgi:hypothetical protein
MAMAMRIGRKEEMKEEEGLERREVRSCEQQIFVIFPIIKKVFMWRQDITILHQNTKHSNLEIFEPPSHVNIYKEKDISFGILVELISVH